MSDKFKRIKTKDLINELSKNEEFKKEYEEQKPFYEVQRAIIAARTKAGITQKELAKKIGISAGDLSKIERGKENTTIKTLYKVANALDKNLEISFV
jgi:DNA-binding XRE family transcriptional regulator